MQTMRYAAALLWAIAACSDGTAPAPPVDGADVLEGMAVGEVRVFADPQIMKAVELPDGSEPEDFLFIGANANTRPDAIGTYEASLVGGGAIAGVGRHPVPLGATAAQDVPSDDAMWFSMRFEARMRARERALLANAAAARRALGSRLGAAAVSGAVSVGDVIQMRVPDAEGENLCASFFEIQAIVRAIGTHSIIVEDAQAPAGGFDSEDFQEIAQEFDALIYPTVVKYFGMPSDFDANDRIVILYTPRVNALTPRGTAGLVGGFFFGGDLFPRKDENDRDICPGSNEGEVFYLLAPDPTGQFSDPRTVDAVRQGTRGTIAHEFQHMVNLGSRLLVTDLPFEATWLNEALSHMAEGLVGRVELGLPEFGNIGWEEITQDPDAFRAFFYQNFARFRFWLQRPDTASATSNKAGESLAVRGAAWAFLRWTTDQYSGGDVARFLRSITVGRDTGIANVVEAAGAPFDSLMAGWMVANYADDAGIPGLSPRYQYLSYDMREIETRLPPARTTYPLRVVALEPDDPGITLQAPSGSGNYFRAVPAAGAPAVFRLRAPAGGPVDFPGARLYVLRVD